MNESQGARVLGPADGRAGMLGSMGVRFMLAGEETDGGFALVEHPIPPRALAAPLHRHTHEDEYSFVLEGRVGRVDVDFLSGPKPTGTFREPSLELVAEKKHFGASRRARWFNG